MTVSALCRSSSSSCRLAASSRAVAYFSSSASTTYFAVSPGAERTHRERGSACLLPQPLEGQALLLEHGAHVFHVAAHVTQLLPQYLPPCRISHSRQRGKTENPTHLDVAVTGPQLHAQVLGLLDRHARPQRLHPQHRIVCQHSVRNRPVSARALDTPLRTLRRDAPRMAF
jgi:hypothetical protein